MPGAWGLELSHEHTNLAQAKLPNRQHASYQSPARYFTACARRTRLNACGLKCCSRGSDGRLIVGLYTFHDAKVREGKYKGKGGTPQSLVRLVYQDDIALWPGKEQKHVRVLLDTVWPIAWGGHLCSLGGRRSKLGYGGY